MPSLSAAPNAPPKSKSLSKTKRPRNVSESGSDDEKQMPNTIAHDWSAAVREWGELLDLTAGQYVKNRDKIVEHLAPYGKYSKFEYDTIPGKSDSVQCACSHNIQVEYRVRHKDSGIVLVMGSTCINYFGDWAASEITRLRLESIGRVRCRALCGRMAPAGKQMHKTCAKRLEHIGWVARGRRRICHQCKLPVALCKCPKCEDCAALGLSCTGGVGFTYCGKHSERRESEEKARKKLAEVRWVVARRAARRCIYRMHDAAQEQNDADGIAEAKAHIIYHREEVYRRHDRIEAEQEAIASAIAAEKAEAKRKSDQRAAEWAEAAKYPCIKCKKRNKQVLAVPRDKGARKYCQIHLDGHERRKKERAAEALRVHNAKRAKRKAKRKAERAKRKQS